MKYKILSILLFIVMVYPICSTNKNPFTTKTSRNEFFLEKTRNIDSVFALQTIDFKALKGACWASELTQYRSKNATCFYQSFFKNYQSFNADFKYVVWQNIYSLFPDDYLGIANDKLREEPNEKVFALIVNYLFRANAINETDIKALVTLRFPEFKNNVHLWALLETLKPDKTPDAAMINDLIEFCKAKNRPSILLFVSKDRNKVGKAIFIDKKGKLLKKGIDTLEVNMLARSVTNMPAYLTNGNTPAGVFSVQGFAVSDNVFIGKSPMIISRLPFEVSVKDFSFSEYNDAQWSMEVYNRFFPASWHLINTKNMAYFAGKAGRSEIIIHGTTIDPDYYKDADYYPHTPSLGCMCTLELWGEKGELLQSEQQRLVKILQKHRFNEAYLYVIEI